MISRVIIPLLCFSNTTFRKRFTFRIMLIAAALPARVRSRAARSLAAPRPGSVRQRRGAGSGRQRDRELLRRFRRHDGQHLGHLSRIHLHHDRHQHIDREPVEHARGLLRLHRLVHGHEIADRGCLGVAAFALGLARFVLGAFQLVEARFDTALRILEQALAQLELLPLLLDLLAPLAEPLEQRPLGRRGRLTEELDGQAASSVDPRT